MTFSFPEILGTMPSELRRLYQITRDTHADDLASKTCRICGVSRCPEWRRATRELILSGESLSPRITSVPAPRLPQ